ncbi:MAG: hypothetical protein ACT4P7_21025 [Gemmatimonadaceae bacterium]
MPLWDKLRSELDSAGRKAQRTIDEGRLRLEGMRARQYADRAAQALGYAVHKDHAGLQALDETARARLLVALTERLNEVAKLEEQLKAARQD